MSLKIQLDEAFQHRASGEERLAHLDAALKQCMQQLRFVREEQEKRIHDAVMKTSREFEKTQMVLEEKLAETNKRLAKVIAENAHLGKALMLKEKLIEELNRQLNQVEADFSSLMTRLESTEKDNSSLKYEVRVLEKELEIRNEEREFNCRTADASHKQHLESVKKIAKLESECQRLRLLVRKRLPGPAALAKMKNEVEMLGRDSIEMRRKSNPTGLMFDSMGDNSSEISKRISMLTEQLYAMEEENKALREVLIKKTNEIQSSRNMHARTASQPSQVESQLEESSKGLMLMEPRRNSFMSHELSLASMSETGSDDKASCAESWASALISELEHFRNDKQKRSLSKRGVGSSDLNLMDDFVEMEKLAVDSVSKPDGQSRVSLNEANPNAGPLENRYSSEVVGSQIVPVSDSESGFSMSKPEIRYSFNGNYPVWLQDTLKLVLEQNRVTGRNFEEIIEDVRVALAQITHTKPGELVSATEGSNHLDASNLSPFTGKDSLKHSNKILEMDSSYGVIDVNMSQSDMSSKHVQPDKSKFICKMIELIEGISLPSSDYDNTANHSTKEGNCYSYKNSETPTGYVVRVLQWKTSELSDVLQQYVHVCYDLLNGKADLGTFVQELTTALEWIINHCFSLQDVSSMRDAIIKQFDWDESRSESEAEGGIMGHFPEADKAHILRQQFLHLPSAAASNGHSIQAEELKSSKVEESRKSKDELIDIQSSKKEMEGRLKSATDKSEYLMKQLQESEKVTGSLQTEMQAFKKSKGVIEDKIENQTMMNEDLDAQLKVARGELNEARQKSSSLEVELENKNHCFEELQATCVELQLQIERYQ